MPMNTAASLLFSLPTRKLHLRNTAFRRCKGLRMRYERALQKKKHNKHKTHTNTPEGADARVRKRSRRRAESARDGQTARPSGRKTEGIERLRCSSLASRVTARQRVIFGWRGSDLGSVPGQGLPPHGLRELRTKLFIAFSILLSIVIIFLLFFAHYIASSARANWSAGSQRVKRWLRGSFERVRFSADKCPLAGSGCISGMTYATASTARRAGLRGAWL